MTVPSRSVIAGKIGGRHNCALVPATLERMFSEVD
jgi:hypothetical protein